MEWHLSGTRSDDESSVTLRLSNRYQLGVFPAETWRADAASEMVEFIGAAKSDMIVVHLGGKTSRISIAKEIGDE